MTIRQEVSRLKMKYQTDDPYEICEYLDIQVMDRPMGKSPRSCKGFFLVSSRCKLIVINSDLPDSIQRIIIAHELGHAVLHSDSAINTFHEFAMFEDTNRMEYSADRVCVVMRLPEPTMPLHCKMIGCSVKFDGSCPVWRTVELTEQGSFFLCGWNADHTHMVISEVGAETEECVRRMTEELSFPIMIDIKSFKL